jgi:hypothetical protein
MSCLIATTFELDLGGPGDFGVGIGVDLKRLWRGVSAWHRSQVLRAG